VTVRIYVEGGGDSKELRTRCREGFSKLIERAGFQGRMPRVIACGPRSGAFDSFQSAVSSNASNDYPMLLVDSEDPVTRPAWDHLRCRDNWVQPVGAVDDQAQMMVTSMETWILADRKALREIFGPELSNNALLPEAGLEARSRDEVLATLENATHNCGSERAYRKGRRSFQALAQLDPATLKQHLPHFLQFVSALQKHSLPAGA
jgi:hypothetical protein